MAVRLGDPVEKSYGREDINDRYHRYDKILGRGAYKTVYWAWDTSEGVDVAWNCIDLDALPTEEERSKISREVEMLKALNHKHILRIRDHWENHKTNQLCFITDILQGGSLREYIRQRKVNLGRVKSWCNQILDALRYLHNSEPVIIHRDLKCDNIFIDGPSGNITIGDLGLSTKYASTTLNREEKGMSIVGTPEFMAPELYEEQYDEKVDIYAFGMCILEMISKKYPYEECTNQIQVIRKVTEKKQPDILRKIHRYVRTFIELCIERDPKKRPTACELLQHPFLTYMDDLKNKQCASDFVFTENRTHKFYKEMEAKENESRQKQLSIIPEQNTANSKSPSPKNERISQMKKTKRVKASQKLRSKKKYVSGTTVNVEDCGKISVKLKIHHDKESQKVKFQYDPQTEDIGSVVREMVETLELDQRREGEIVKAIKSKLDSLEEAISPRPSTPISNIQSIKHSQTKPEPMKKSKASSKQQQQQQQPPSINTTNNSHIRPVIAHNNNNNNNMPQQRANTQPPQQIDTVNNNNNNNINNNAHLSQRQVPPQPYSEPPSANVNNAGHAQPAPFYSEPNTAATGNNQAQFEQSVFPKVFNANGTTAHLNTTQQQTNNNTNNAQNAMPITTMLTLNNTNTQRRANKIATKNTSKPLYNKSAPVTPGQSPENEKKMGGNRGGYSSDTGSEFVLREAPYAAVTATGSTSNLQQQSQQQQQPPQQAVESNNNGNAKPVNDSLLDQIMALPQDTIKSRIVQFGGSYHDDDGPGILVTKLFQLLSANDNSSRPAPKSTSQQPTKVPPPQNLQVQQSQQSVAVVNMNNPSNPQQIPQNVQQQQHPQQPPAQQIINNSVPNSQQSDEIVINQQSNDEQSAALVMRHVSSTNNIQHIGSQNNLQNLNVNNHQQLSKQSNSFNHSEIPSNHVSNTQSQHPTPPNTVTKQPLRQQYISINNTSINNNNAMQNNPNNNNNNNNNASISPPNELIVYTQNVSNMPPQTNLSHKRQTSAESIASNHSHQSHQSHYSQQTDSPKSMISHQTMSPKAGHQRSHSQLSNISIPSVPSSILQPNIPQIIDDSDDEIDPNIELPKLRVRQKELMKAKIASQREKLKQRNPIKLGRDKTIDNIASELAEVEKQIKILTDASKTNTKVKIPKKEKTINISRPPSVEPESNRGSAYHSRNNSIDSAKLTPPRTVNKPQEPANNVRPKTVTKVPFAKIPSANDIQQQLSVDHNVTNLNHSVVGTASNSGSVSMLLDTDDQPLSSPFHISSPLVSSSHRDEFESHLRNLPDKLDLEQIGGDMIDINRYINSLFNKSQTNLKAVSDTVLQNAKDRVIREKKQLEEEYKQYYADQTEMLLLKLQKHRHNHPKCVAETQSTRVKLCQKQEKQKNKFKSIVKDQLQILQLTQELNDDGASSSIPANTVSSPQQTAINTVTGVPANEFYLYKEEMDKIYLEKVQQFEAKQKRELESFRSDLQQLNSLRLEKKKRESMRSLQSVQSVSNISNGSSPKHPSPARVDRMDDARLFGFQLTSQNSTQSVPQLSMNQKQTQMTHQRNSHSSPAVQIDILTGLVDEIPNDEQSSSGNPFYHPVHHHSTSLPIIENVSASNVINNAPPVNNNNNNNNMINGNKKRGSKFRVSAPSNMPQHTQQQVSYRNVVTNNTSNNVNSTQHQHTQSMPQQHLQHQQLIKRQHQHSQSQHTIVQHPQQHASQHLINNNNNVSLQTHPNQAQQQQQPQHMQTGNSMNSQRHSTSNVSNHNHQSRTNLINTHHHHHHNNHNENTHNNYIHQPQQTNAANNNNNNHHTLNTSFNQ